MKRLAVALLALAVLAAPIAVETHSAGKVWRIGYLALSGNASWAFRGALSDLGYVTGRNIVIEARLAHGMPDRLAELAADLVRINVDVIVTTSTHAALAAKAATTAIPIVMAGSSRPVERGLVASLAHPGGNVTGLTTDPGPGLLGKQLQLLREATPKIRRVGVFWNAMFQREREEVEAAATSLGVATFFADVKAPSPLDPIFTAMIRERPDALLLFALYQDRSYPKEVVRFAATNGLPTMFGEREAVQFGG